jgi:protoporphyrinogen oxidase
VSMDDFLRSFGFSDRFISRFARPFLGGIFVDRSLGGSARQFLKVWNELGTGQTVLPEGGIEAIPRKLSENLSADRVRLHSGVTSIEQDERGFVVHSESGEFHCKLIVLAVPFEVVKQLTGIGVNADWKESATLYFDAEHCPVEERYLVLNPNEGVVNHLAPMSLVQPSYAPVGKHLVSLTCLKGLELHDEALASEALKEVSAWFPESKVIDWKLIKVHRNQHAQLRQGPGFHEHQAPIMPSGIFLAGECVSASSINDAVASGRKVANLVGKALDQGMR